MHSWGRTVDPAVQEKRRVHVSGLPKDLTKEELEGKLREVFPDTERVDVPARSGAIAIKGYAFVDYHTRDEAERAIQELNRNVEVDGRALWVSEHRARSAADDSRGANQRSYGENGDANAGAFGDNTRASYASRSQLDTKGLYLGPLPWADGESELENGLLEIARGLHYSSTQRIDPASKPSFRFINFDNAEDAKDALEAMRARLAQGDVGELRVDYKKAKAPANGDDSYNRGGGSSARGGNFNSRAGGFGRGERQVDADGSVRASRAPRIDAVKQGRMDQPWR